MLINPTIIGKHPRLMQIFTTLTVGLDFKKINSRNYEILRVLKSLLSVIWLRWAFAKLNPHWMLSQGVFLIFHISLKRYVSEGNSVIKITKHNMKVKGCDMWRWDFNTFWAGRLATLHCVGFNSMIWLIFDWKSDAWIIIFILWGD